MYQTILFVPLFPTFVLVTFILFIFASRYWCVSKMNKLVKSPENVNPKLSGARSDFSEGRKQSREPKTSSTARRNLPQSSQFKYYANEHVYETTLRVIPEMTEQSLQKSTSHGALPRARSNSATSSFSQRVRPIRSCSELSAGFTHRNNPQFMVETVSSAHHSVNYEDPYDYEDPETRFKKTLRASTALPIAVNISRNRAVLPIRQPALFHQPKVEDGSVKIEPAV